MRHPPAEVIASWPEPNFINPMRHSYATVVILAIFGSLTWLAVIARIWARAVVQRNSGADDWVMLASLVPTTVLLIGVGFANQRLFDRHIWDYTPTEYINQRKITFSNELTYVIASGMVKASVLLFYRRMIFKAVRKTYRLITIISLISVILYTLGFILAIMFSCRPLNAFWDKFNASKLKAGLTYKCYNEPVHILSASIIGTVQDFIATSLPTIICWNLQISLKQRIALNTCFGIGYVVTIISAVRCYAIYYVCFNTYDVPWYAWYVWNLTGLEVVIGTICASIPALKIFFIHFRDTVSQSRDNNTKSTSWSSRFTFPRIRGSSRDEIESADGTAGHALSAVRNMRSYDSETCLNGSYTSKGSVASK